MKLADTVLAKALFALLAGLSIFAGAASAQETVEIREPAVVKFEDLFRQADVVAFVKILSGDTENYPTAVYKAKVLQPFKGFKMGDQFFFGPYISYGLGSEYLVFLRSSDKQVEAKSKLESPGLSYGTLHLDQIMYQGYSVMPVEYVCAFRGKTISERCDYGIRINTHQVILPRGVKTYPSDLIESSDRRWVRKAALIPLLLNHVGRS